MKETSLEITKELQKRINEMPKATQYDPKRESQTGPRVNERKFKTASDDVERAVANRVYLFDQHKLQKERKKLEEQH